MSDNIWYSPNLQSVLDVTQHSQRTVDDLREVRQSLEPVQQAVGEEILSSAMILTPEKMQKALVKNPWEVLIDTRPVSLAAKHHNPDMVPVLFSYNGVYYIGWQMRSTLVSAFDCQYQEFSAPSQSDLPASSVSLEIKAQLDTASELFKRGDNWLLLGKRGKAQAAYKQGHEIFKKLALDNPQNPSVKRDLSISLEKLGNVQLQLGNVHVALEAYKQSLNLRQKFAKNDPNNSMVVCYLSVNLENIGDVQLQLGNSQVALEAYQQSLNVNKLLAEDDPDSYQIQRSLMVNHYKLAKIQKALEKPDATLQAYQQALVIAEKLAAKDKHNQSAQNDLRILRDLVNA